MNFSIYLLLGPLIAYAVKRRNAPDELGLWRPLVGLAAALFPIVADAVIAGFGPTWEARLARGPFWSPLFWPVWSLAIALICQLISQHKWHRFLPITLSAMGSTWLLALLTSEGIAPLAPLFDYHLKLPLIFGWDWLLFLFLFSGLAITVIVRPFRRDVARLTLVVALGYIMVLATFLFKASDFSSLYARSLSLDVARSYVLPQPMSPFNWRLIHVTTEGKLHDTRVNIFLKEAVDVPDDAKRSWRLRELYQPTDKAVWRIYSRFGRKLSGTNKEFVEKSWQALENSPYRWQTRFMVYRGFVQFSSTRCVKWQDLRRIGAKKKWLGTYLTCLAPAGFTLYRADDSENFTFVKTLTAE